MQVKRSHHWSYVRGVGDELPEKDLFVGVEGVNNERHQLGNLCLEGKGLGLLILAHFFRHLRKESRYIIIRSIKKV